MDTRLLAIALQDETDIIAARQRTRTIASMVGFDAQDQTRITTAVSEIVRNALEYGGGGRIEYHIKGSASPQVLEIVVSDRGPGIADVDAILSGRYRSANGMGVGIVGASRLMDDLRIETQVERGTRVVMAKRLPRRAPPITAKERGRIAHALADQSGPDPMAEVRRQNQDLLLQFRELQKRQEELQHLNQELQDTNRGVVALYAELDERADHLRRADQLKSRFLSNMSHEFRTPLNSILSLTRLLLARADGALSGEQEKQIQFIRKSAENLTELVNDLLDLAKVEAGRIEIAPKEFSVTDLFGALRGMLKPILVGDNVSLIFDDAAADLKMITDEGKVSQILRNFISNAIKFTERGEIRVWADFDPRADTITFSVRDTGIGIAEEDVAVIWQEFGQVSNKLQSKVKGTGLGLPLSKKLAMLLGGDVAVVTAPAQGSVFSVTVPRVFRRSGEAAPLPPQWTLEPGRVPVLALEDNLADSFGFERSLAHSRYQAIPAQTIAEAKQAMEQVTPAAILLDVVLEGEDSWRFLLDVKQNEKTRSIPVVVVSTTEEERKARSLGADEYLAKPVDAPRLIKVLDEVTGGQSITKVLLVDDEEVSRYLVRQLLPRAAFDLKEVDSGTGALRSARAERPDVVLFDLNMQQMDGFELLDRMSRSDDLRGLPAVAITSKVLNDDDQSRLRGAARIISKYDLTTETLVTAIREAVGSGP